MRSILYGEGIEIWTWTLVISGHRHGMTDSGAYVALWEQEHACTRNKTIGARRSPGREWHASHINVAQEIAAPRASTPGRTQLMRDGDVEGAIWGAAHTESSELSEGHPRTAGGLEWCVCGRDDQ